MINVRSTLTLLLLTAGVCFGQRQPCNPGPFSPSLWPPCGGIAKKAFDAASASGLMTPMAPLNVAIADARSRFWKVFATKDPRSQEYQDAQAAFRGALLAKDIHYLLFSLQQGVTGEMETMNKILNIDGGIRPFAFPLYVEWVKALRRAEGRDKDGQYAQPLIYAEAFSDKSYWRRGYEDARDWAEFLSSGLDISKYVKDPDAYMVSQMESDVFYTVARSNPENLPDPRDASREMYEYFEQTFGKDKVHAAAAAVLQTPKNSIGGLATRAEVVIGDYQPAPSPNPYLLFLTKATNSSAKGYAIALCMDQTALLVSGHALETLNSKEQWAKAVSVYGQLVARFGEPAVLTAAGRLKDVPKDDRGGPQGDPDDKGAIFWFTTLLKDPKTQLPGSAHFLASSYDPRWVGKQVQVRGTVSRVDLDTNGSPQYATIHFKESKNDRFTAFTPNPEILERYGQNFSGLIGKPIEIWGQVHSWRAGSGVRILIAKQLKVLDAGALANFRESAPDWMKAPAPAENLVDSPRYLAWKKFPPGAKASYENDVLHEYRPGTNQYTKTTISRTTFTLESIDNEQAIVKVESTVSGKIAGRNGPDTSSADQIFIKAKQAAPGAAVNDPGRTVTSGEDVVVIHGKKIATRWECITRAGDPLTFTKTWTSDEVPGGLVRTQQQSHSQITGQTYRDIRQTVYVPTDGVDPQLGHRTSATPSAARQ